MNDQGGNIEFTTGMGFNAPNGAFVFNVPLDSGGSREILRINPDGKFFVDGRYVQDDVLVYEGFRAWIANAIATLGRNAKITNSLGTVTDQ
jgi:hypothetical protein